MIMMTKATTMVKKKKKKMMMMMMIEWRIKWNMPFVMRRHISQVVAPASLSSL